MSIVYVYVVYVSTETFAMSPQTCFIVGIQSNIHRIEVSQNALLSKTYSLVVSSAYFLAEIPLRSPYRLGHPENYLFLL